jgi:hypothetical protein
MSVRLGILALLVLKELRGGVNSSSFRQQKTARMLSNPTFRDHMIYHWLF